MAHLALHFPVVKRKIDSRARAERSALKELPVRFVFMGILVLFLFSVFLYMSAAVPIRAGRLSISTILRKEFSVNPLRGIQVLLAAIGFAVLVTTLKRRLSGL
jgi:hypothetical protein